MPLLSPVDPDGLGPGDRAALGSARARRGRVANHLRAEGCAQSGLARRLITGATASSEPGFIRLESSGIYSHAPVAGWRNTTRTVSIARRDRFGFGLGIFGLLGFGGSAFGQRPDP